MNMQYKNLFVDIKGIDDSRYTITGVFSTEDVDRHGEVVDQKSWLLEEYLKNPVVLFAHDHTQPAIGKVISLAFNEDGNLEGTIQFAAKEYEFANTIYKLYKGGFMRAFSVGFQNEATEIEEEGEKVILKKNTLFEISTVNVPANALALAKSKGIDTSPLEKHLSNTPLMPTVEKEGRVLSAKNKAIIAKARDTLDELLNADEGKSINQPSNDTAVPTVKVETPPSKGVQVSPARILNKAVRALLQEKRNLTN
jgi:Escherichia/Staphylococcus phage prohead protease